MNEVTEEMKKNAMEDGWSPKEVEKGYSIFTSNDIGNGAAYKASTKAKAGESLYRDIVYPITKEFREQLHGEPAFSLMKQTDECVCPVFVQMS